MKHVKKLLAVVMSAALAMAMCVSAFATSTTTSLPKKEINITNNANNNTYAVYRIMEVTSGASDGNYVFAPVEPFNEFFTDANSDYKFEDGKVQKKDGTIVFGKLSTKNNNVSDQRGENTNTSDTAELATALANWARTHNAPVVGRLNQSNENKGDFDIGWYLVDETESGITNDENASAEVASKPMLIDLTQGNAAVAPKNEFVNLNKVIVEGEDEKEKNSAQIGDDISYKVTTVTPKYEANVNVDALKFVLTDTFSDGLTYNENSMVVSAVELAPSDYKVSVSGQTVKVWFSRKWLKAHQGTAITLNYSAKLNGQAEVNSTDGNPNTIALKYSNNPGQVKASDVANNEDLPENPDDDDDNPNTPNGIPTKELEDKVVTYTYGIDIIKVDGHDNTELNGAEFTIQDSENKDVKFVKVSETNTEVVYRVATDKDTDTVTTLIAPNGGAKIIVKGLDADTYSLTETKAPDEYTVLAESIKVTIKEKTGKVNKEVTVTEYDASGNRIGEPKVVTEEVDGPTGHAEYTVNSVAVTTLPEFDKDGNVVKEGEKSGDTSAQGGSIQMNVYVPNEKGMSMPETGSRTAMYCMIGGAAVIVLGAGYYLMGARRNKKEQ